MVATLTITFAESSFSDGIITSLFLAAQGHSCSRKRGYCIKWYIDFFKHRNKIQDHVTIAYQHWWPVRENLPRVSAYTTICPAPLLTVFSHHLLWNVGTCMKFGDQHLRMTLKYLIWAWTYGSMVKSNCYSFRTPRFHSRHPYDSS